MDQSATPANNLRDVEIGGAWGGGPPTRFFHGMIDEVTYYSRALTAAETQSIYASGSLGKCKPPQMLPQFSGTGFNFGFQSVSNQSYTIQRNDDLTTTNWIIFTNFTGDGSLLQLVSPVTNAPQRFFRPRRGRVAPLQRRGDLLASAAVILQMRLKPALSKSSPALKSFRHY